MYFFVGDIIGGVISAVILKQPQDNTTTSEEEIALYCGMNDCPWNNYTSGNWTRPSNSTVCNLLHQNIILVEEISVLAYITFLQTFAVQKCLNVHVFTFACK